MSRFTEFYVIGTRNCSYKSFFYFNINLISSKKRENIFFVRRHASVELLQLIIGIYGLFETTFYFTITFNVNEINIYNYLKFQQNGYIRNF
jgi:hypothetical protein